MDMLDNGKMEELADNVKEYFTTNIELVKLEVIQSVSESGSSMLSTFLIGIVGLLSLFFISLGAGFYLTTRIGDNYSGFVIISGFYLLLGIILMLGRKKILEIPIRNKIIRNILGKK